MASVAEPPAGFVIRPAAEADTAGVAAVWGDAYYDQEGVDDLPAEFLAERQPGSFAPRAAARVADTLVACDEATGAVVGVCVCVGGEVDQFFVARGARGTGLASALLARGEALMAARGEPTAKLYTYPQNKRARRFYEKCGWRLTGPAVHDVEISGGRTFTLDLVRYDKALPQPVTS